MLTNADKQRLLATGVRGVMCVATSATQTRFRPWNQYLLGSTKGYDDWVGGGQCRGLSIVYLHAVKHGIDFTRLATDRELSRNYPYRGLQYLIDDASLQGNSSASLVVANAYARRRFGLIQQRSTKTTGGGAIARAVTANLGYYIIGTKKHAMAATVRMSGYTFFDPNGGIAVSNDKSKFKAMLALYFDHWFIKKLYGKGSKVRCEVARYAFA